MPSCVWWHVWRAITIVKSIYRAALIAMQPCAVSAERDEVGKRCVGVVPHDEDEETEMPVSWQRGSCLSTGSVNPPRRVMDEATRRATVLTPLPLQVVLPRWTRRYRVTVLTPLPLQVVLPRWTRRYRVTVLTPLPLQVVLPRWTRRYRVTVLTPLPLQVVLPRWTRRYCLTVLTSLLSDPHPHYLYCLTVSGWHTVSTPRSSNQVMCSSTRSNSTMYLPGAAGAVNSIQIETASSGSTSWSSEARP